MTGSSWSISVGKKKKSGKACTLDIHLQIQNRFHTNGCVILKIHGSSQGFPLPLSLLQTFLLVSVRKAHISCIQNPVRPLKI